MPAATKGRRRGLPGRRESGRFLGVAIGRHSLGVVAIVVLPSVPNQVGWPLHILSPLSQCTIIALLGGVVYLHALRSSLVSSFSVQASPFYLQPVCIPFFSSWSDAPQPSPPNRLLPLARYFL